MNYDPALLSGVLYRVTNLVIDRGCGAYVYTTDGQRYLDFTSGIGVTSTGHCHPKVVAAIQEQASKIIHAQINIYFHEPAFRLATALHEVLPRNLDTYFFSNSGAEAVEAAVKLARHATGRDNVVVFQGAFHGRTGQTTAMTTSKGSYRAGYQPLASGICVAPYPYSYRYGWTPDATSAFCLDQLDFLLHSQTTPEDTAAIVVEPVLGEGGYVVPPSSFLPGLRELCTKHGILLVVDEVQSGCGRTGKFFAYEHFDIEPDIVVMAKGLGSGFPISAIAAPRQVMDRWEVGSHGGTYGGNPIGCAAAEATIGVLKEEGLVENAAERGEQLLYELCSIQREFPRLGDIRGLGLMVGCEFSHPLTRQPMPELANQIIKSCLKRGLLLMGCGTYGNIVRWIPPLIVTKEQIWDGVSIFQDALNETRDALGVD